MRKTRSLIGKTLLAMLTLFAISLPFMTSASAIYTPYAIPTASIFLSPSRISGTSGTTVNVNLNINSIQGLSTSGAGITFNHHTAQCTGVADGSFMSTQQGLSTIFLPGGIDNNLGVVGYSSETEKGTASANGSGTMLTFQFTMNGTGTSYSDLHIIYFEALAVDGSNIPCRTIDYFTTSPGPIVQIIGDPQGGAGKNPYPGFNNQGFSPIDKIVDSTTYKGNVSFVIFSPDFANSPGFFNVTIPNALMSCSTPDQWYVALNGAPIWGASRIVQTNATYTVISLEFTYGSPATEAVQILSTVAVPEFASMLSSVLLAAVLVLATFAVALFSITTRSHKRKG